MLLYLKKNTIPILIEFLENKFSTLDTGNIL